MIFFSVVILTKLDHNPVKKETSKLSLGMITSDCFGIFYNCISLLILLDTEVFIGSYTLFTVLSFFYEGNRCIKFVIILSDGGNICLSFFNIIKFRLLCFFLLIEFFIPGEFAYLLQLRTNKSAEKLFFNVDTIIISRF